MNLVILSSFLIVFLLNLLIAVVIFYHFKKFKLKNDKLGDFILIFFLAGFLFFALLSFLILITILM